jgi:hypothetical protein
VSASTSEVRWEFLKSSALPRWKRAECELSSEVWLLPAHTVREGRSEYLIRAAQRTGRTGREPHAHDAREGDQQLDDHPRGGFVLRVECKLDDE